MGKIFRKLTSSSSDSWLIQGMLQIDHLGADVLGSPNVAAEPFGKTNQLPQVI